MFLSEEESSRLLVIEHLMTWTVTVINDVDFKFPHCNGKWMQFIAQYADGSGAPDPAMDIK